MAVKEGTETHHKRLNPQRDIKPGRPQQVCLGQEAGSAILDMGSKDTNQSHAEPEDLS